MSKTRGFFTVATGDEHYYRIAANLLRSYRHFSKEALPFALICDRENAFTREFDQCVLLDEPANTYLDKLRLFDCLPFDEGIFIDADCLAYGDLNEIFDHFASADDFCCYGRVLPLDDKTGWFNYEDLGDLQSAVSYCVGLHGGIYYLRKTEKCARVFATAKQISRDYRKFNFKGKFSTPGDEPIMALSMALEGCRPIPFRDNGICCYWEHENAMILDIARGIARVKKTGASTHLVHWGTRFTRGLLYQKQVAALRLTDSTGKRRTSNFCYDVKIHLERAKHFALRVKNKLRRMAKGQR